MKQKIISTLLVIMLIEYCVPVTSKAADWGGVLFTPIQNLVVALGDVGSGVLNLIVNQGDMQSVITIDTDAKTWKDYLEMFFRGATIVINPIGNGIYFAKKAYTFGKKHFTKEDFVTEIELPVMLITPDKIFSNEVPLLDVNIINPKDKNSASYILQSTIAKWYIVLRNIAIVAFLSMLVYVGIRIVISSTAGDKAKYKQLLKDWLVGLCLLFMMHYGMSFALTLNEKFVEFLASENQSIVIQNDELDFSKFTDVLAGDGYDDLLATVKTFNIDEDGNYVSDKLSWHTDFTGYVRFLAQSNIKSATVATRMGYTVMYVVAVIYTWIFFIKYLKRLLYMIFLTLISPMVAMLYPLDKMNDGSAQTFNTWSKEYIFNLLIQPMHLILYTVLISSAMDLMVKYPVYALVVYGFMLQGEKFIKKMFGFDKASIGASAAGGAFTGAMVMSGLDKAVHMAKGHRLPDGGPGRPPRSKEIGNGDNGKVAYANNRTADSSADDVVEQAFLSGGAASPEGKDDKGNGGEPFQYVGLNENNDNLIGSRYDWQNGYSGTLPNAQGVNGGDGLLNGNNNNNNPYSTNLGDTSQIRLSGTLPGENTPGNISINAPGGQQDTQTQSQKKEEKQQLKSEPKKIGVGKKFSAGAKAFGLPAMRKLAKTGIKMAAVGTLGTAGAMVGVAAGLATDDMSNVVKYGAAGVAGGAAIGNVAASNAINAPKRIYDNVKERSSQARENYMSELYKDDPKAYKQYLNEKSDKEFLKSKEIKQQYAKEFGESNAENMMNQAIEYRKQGITDNKIIINAMKETSGEIGKTSATDSRRIAAAKLATGISGSKDIENMTKRLKAKGYNEKMVSENEEFVRSIKKIKYN